MYEIKVENKNIIITDPCYLDNVMNKKDKTKELDEYWHEFLGNMDSDDYSPRLQRFGFTDNICCGTGYGDWSCTTFRVGFDPTEIKEMEDLEKIDEDQLINIGSFCADAGMVCVVDAEELKKFNPNFFEWAFSHRHCVTAIYDFTGRIGVTEIDPHSKDFPYFRVRVIYGVADKEKNPNGYNFLAYQTGL
jgi:hypothetical protein